MLKFNVEAEILNYVFPDIKPGIYIISVKEGESLKEMLVSLGIRENNLEYINIILNDRSIIPPFENQFVSKGDKYKVYMSLEGG